VARKSLLSVELGCGQKKQSAPQAASNNAAQKMDAAKTPEEHFYALNKAAKQSLTAGNMEDARKYADELLALAPKFSRDWNYGNAIHDGNLILGRIALSEGRTNEAKQFLLQAGASRGSPQMNTFGPNMSLAKDLLEKGERDTVLQYFELCRKFWKMGQQNLDAWSQEVRDGKVPNFGANLSY
jgi:hypothetical protein